MSDARPAASATPPAELDAVQLEATTASVAAEVLKRWTGLKWFVYLDGPPESWRTRTYAVQWSPVAVALDAGYCGA